MASQQPVAEFAVLNLKPGLAFEEESAWKELVAGVKAAEGAGKQYFGRKIEDGDAGVHVVSWRSLADADAFRASGAYGAFTGRLDDLTSTGAAGVPPRQIVRFLLPDPGAADGPSAAAAAAEALFGDAPVTEIFTGYGAEDGFLENVVKFAGLVDDEKTAGYLGGAVGVSIGDDVAKVAGGEAGRAVKLVVGWEAKERHLEAKERAGVIRDEIHLMRGGRKEAEMFHVRFDEL